jgi:hypothetical protein
MYVNPKGATPAQLADALTLRPIAQWNFLTLLPGANAKLDSNHKPEQLPTDLKGPKSYSLSVNLGFGVLVASDPPPAKEFRITQNFAEYASSNSWQGNTFHASTSLDLRIPTVPANKANEYAAFVGKVVAAKSPDDPVASLGDALRAAAMPQSFPDATLKKLPRLGTLACVAPDQPCVFRLLLAYSASRLTLSE